MEQKPKGRTSTSRHGYIIHELLKKTYPPTYLLNIRGFLRRPKLGGYVSIRTRCLVGDSLVWRRHQGSTDTQFLYVCLRLSSLSSVHTQLVRHKVWVDEEELWEVGEELEGFGWVRFTHYRFPPPFHVPPGSYPESFPDVALRLNRNLVLGHSHLLTYPRISTPTHPYTREWILIRVSECKHTTKCQIFREV